ncbi:hypothetical protein SAY87_011861 [Trapa incisa]|uniref:Uncharacterized protein n=1 Tax=Trapa incisa TaxID=236973 RepID=A0AAN7GPG6_9MYRT|nr:hypothetical protein SAY87_011861 [Trapa incisa]
MMEWEYERPRSYSNSHAHGSYNNGYGNSNNMQIQPYYGVGGGGGGPKLPPHELWNYRASYGQAQVGNHYNKDLKLKKGKSASGSAPNPWSFSDPEFKRKKRVAGYKMYSAEGKVKGTFKKSLHWIKDRYSQVVYGWW